MRVALIRAASTHTEHIITQPEHRGPCGPVAHWTLCDRVVYHGRKTVIRGPLPSGAIGDVCRLCERRLESAEMAEQYAGRMEPSQ